MTSTFSANPSSFGEPDWLTSLGHAVDALGAPAGAVEEAASTAIPPLQSTPEAAPHNPGADLFETHEGAGRPVALGTGDLYDTVESLKLTHREIEHYGASMSRAVTTAQLDERFVSSDYLVKGFKGISALGMMPRQQRVHIHGETGMPTYSSWAQVSAVRNLARVANTRDARFTRLHVSTPMSAAARGMLVAIPDQPFNKTAIEVVEIAGEARRFRVHLDAWRSPGLIVRTTLCIDPSKARRFDAQPMRLTKTCEWAMTAELNAMAGSLADQGAAHLAFIVSKHCGPALTGVTQGIIGPVWFNGTVKPDIIEDLFEVAPDNMIACFTAFELHCDANASTNPSWDDPDDASLERLKARGWSATVDKLWVCTSEMRSTIEEYAKAYDTTLKVRPFF